MGLLAAITKEKRREIHRRWRERNKEKERERLKMIRLDNPKKHNENRRIWASDNKEKRTEIQRRYYEKNKNKYLAWTRIRQAKLLQRLPMWSDRTAIIEFYKNRPSGMSVDHIIPLCGKNVSGLHVLENLQYLTRSQNSRKSNSFSGNY